MMLFWTMAVLLLALAAVFVLWPLRHRENGPSKGDLKAYSETNIELYRVHLAELEQSRQAGRLSEDEFEQLKLEQERALLDDEEQLRKAEQAWALSQMGPKFLIAVLVAVILAAVALYQHLGNRQDVQLLHMQQEKLLLDWEDIQAQRNPDPQHSRAASVNGNHLLIRGDGSLVIPQ